MSDRRDVVIVGAGPAGAAAALLLARRGHDVLLLERAAIPRDKPCAEYLSPGVVGRLQVLGVWPSLKGSAPALRGFTIHSPDGRAFSGDFPAVDRLPRTGTAIARTRLDQVLVAAAVRAGAELREQTRVFEVGPGPNPCLAIVDVRGRGDMIAARLVLAADGLHSTVARRFGLAVPYAVPRRLALVTHMAGVTGLGPYGEMHVAVGDCGVRYCGVAPLGRDLANLALVVSCNEASKLRGRQTAFFRDALLTFPDLADRIASAEQVKQILAVGPLAWRARRCSADGVLLLGDAAGFFDPFTGQGIYRALRSAELAADAAHAALLGGDLSAKALSAYDRRRREFLGSQAAERLIQLFIRYPALFCRASRRLATDKALADRLVGVTGDLRPARDVLNPIYLAKMLIGSSAS